MEGGGALVLATCAVFGLQVADALLVARWLEPASVPVGPAVSLAALFLGTSLYGIGGERWRSRLAVLAVAVAAEHLPAVAETAGVAEDVEAVPARPIP